MPEMRVRVRWPDGAGEWIYSPSLVLGEYLVEGERYPLDDFAARSREALTEASARVRAKYGFPCGYAAAALAGIEKRVGSYDGGEVVVEAVAT